MLTFFDLFWIKLYFARLIQHFYKMNCWFKCCISLERPSSARGCLCPPGAARDQSRSQQRPACAARAEPEPSPGVWRENWATALRRDLVCVASWPQWVSLVTSELTSPVIHQWMKQISSRRITEKAAHNLWILLILVISHLSSGPSVNIQPELWPDPAQTRQHSKHESLTLSRQSPFKIRVAPFQYTSQRHIEPSSCWTLFGPLMKFQSKKNSRRTSCPVQTALFTPALLRGRPAAPCTEPGLASLITTNCPRPRPRTPHSRIITSPEWTRITIISERCFLHSTISSQSQSRRSHDWAGASSFLVSPPQSWVRLTARSLRTPASVRHTASAWPPWPGPRAQPPGSGATQAAAGARHTRAHAAQARASPDQRYAAASRCPKRSSTAREIKVSQQNDKLDKS